MITIMYKGTSTVTGDVIEKTSIFQQDIKTEAEALALITEEMEWDRRTLGYTEYEYWIVEE